MRKIIAVLLLWMLNSCSTHSTSTNVRSTGTDTLKSVSAHTTSIDTVSNYAAHIIYDTLKGKERFIGVWAKDCNFLCALTIEEQTSDFCVVFNQLILECRNSYHGDTLYLYVISSDQGRGFTGPKYYPPKAKSLFAKCYTAGNELKIIYTQAEFRKNIELFGLDTLLHKCHWAETN